MHPEVPPKDPISEETQSGLSYPCISMSDPMTALPFDRSISILLPAVPTFVRLCYEFDMEEHRHRPRASLPFTVLVLFSSMPA